MIRISSLLRSAIMPNLNSIRGPKKKKGEAEVKLQSLDVVNIFKQRSDPVIREISQYPIFVQELSYGNHTFHEFMRGIQHDSPTFVRGQLKQKPGRANFNGYLKAFKRQKAKGIGLWRHIDASPDIMDENNDLHLRRDLIGVGLLSKEQQAEKQKEQQAIQAAAAEEQDDQE